MGKLQAPFSWFGGKSRVADIVWQRFGDVDNYIEPFAGSLAVLLGRPHAPQIETVNDLDCFIANFWRAVSADPEAVARYADNPVNEADLTARHVWLVNRQEFRDRMSGDPDYCDAKIAGWWVWGACCWIGSGWCSGKGPWFSDGGVIRDARQRPHLGNTGRGVNRNLPHLGNTGRGVNRNLPHLGNTGRGVNRNLPHLGDTGRGVNRNLPHLGDADRAQFIREWMLTLQARLRDVRVACGDWSRVCGDSVLFAPVKTRARYAVGVFLDPPYSGAANREDNLYAEDSLSVARDAAKWAAENGDNPNLRIALCGYEGEHDFLEGLGWGVVEWKAVGGYGNQGSGRGKENARRERVWFSPYCLRAGDNVANEDTEKIAKGTHPKSMFDLVSAAR